jgi:Spy/CpxP family protein refolding chaperone
MRSKHNTTKANARAGILMALTAAGILLSQVSFAEPGHTQQGDKEERRQEHRQQMQEQFGVTDEQFAQMHEIRKNGGSRKDAQAVLSDDQRQQMRTWREENPRKGGPHGKHKGNRNGGEPGSQDDS